MNIQTLQNTKARYVSYTYINNIKFDVCLDYQLTYGSYHLAKLCYDMFIE